MPVRVQIFSNVIFDFLLCRTRCDLFSMPHHVTSHVIVPVRCYAKKTKEKKGKSGMEVKLSLENFFFKPVVKVAAQNKWPQNRSSHILRNLRIDSFQGKKATSRR